MPYLIKLILQLKNKSHTQALSPIMHFEHKLFPISKILSAEFSCACKNTCTRLNLHKYDQVLKQSHYHKDMECCY